MIELVIRVVDNVSLVLNGFLIAWLWHANKRKEFWYEEWFKVLKEVRELKEKLTKFEEVQS